MKLDHYLSAVSRAVEAHEQKLDAAFEAYSDLCKQVDVSDATALAAIDAAFVAELGRAYLGMMDTLSNLRKWPRT